MHLDVCLLFQGNHEPPKLVPELPEVRAVLIEPRHPLPLPVPPRQAEIPICGLSLENIRLLGQEESLEVIWGIILILKMEKMRPELEKLRPDPGLMIPGSMYSLVCIFFVSKGGGSMGSIPGLSWGVGNTSSCR